MKTASLPKQGANGLSHIPRVVLSIEYITKYGRGLLRGISKYIRFNGPWNVLGMPGFHIDPESPKDTIDFEDIRNFAPDGLILRTTREYEKIKALGIPVLMAVDSDDPTGVPCIVSDYEETGRMAADYLLERGFKNFAFCGFAEMAWSRSRGDFFEKFINEAGYTVERYEGTDHEKDAKLDERNRLLGQWLESLPKPIALFCCADFRSQQVVEAAKSASIAIPDELAILSVDDDDLFCTLTDPPISSIALDTETAGYEAAELLGRLMNGEKPDGQRIIVKPTRVISRLSTEIIAIDDKEIAKALRYILTHARGWIQVDDVAEHVGLSRRTLERRFRKAIGRSVYGEIRKTRIQLVSRMLLETNLTISQVSYALGYSCPENLSQSFQREMGLSPQAYRVKHSAAGHGGG